MVFKSLPQLLTLTFTVPESEPSSNVAPHAHSAFVMRQSVLPVTIGSCVAIKHL